MIWCFAFLFLACSIFLATPTPVLITYIIASVICAVWASINDMAKKGVKNNETKKSVNNNWE